MKKITLLILLLFFFYDGFSQNDFITTWDVSSGETITIPTTGGGYSYSVDWGDGSPIETGITGNAVHTYIVTNASTIIKISGNFPRIYFNNNAANKDDIITIEQWGDIQWTTFWKAFQGCTNLTAINATDVPNLSNVISFANAFQNVDLTTVHNAINSWNVSNIQFFNAMFGTTNFNGNIGGWDVSGGTRYDWMFSGCPNFNQDISGWDVDLGTNFVGMFNQATSFDQDLGSWDISSVVQIAKTPPATGFSSGLDLFLQSTTLSVGNYDSLLTGWNQLINDKGNPPNLQNLTFNGGSSKYCFSEIDRTSLINDKGWTIVDADEKLCELPFITNWNVSANDVIEIPSSGTRNYTIDWGDGTIETGLTGNASHTYSPTYTSTAPDGLTTIEIKGQLPTIKLMSAVGNDKLISIEQWGTMPWTTMEGSFENCINLKFIHATDSPILDNVIWIRKAFKNTDLTGVTNQLNNWNVSTIERFSSTFANSKFNGDISNWNVSNVTHFDWTFSAASNFNQDISDWNTAKVINMAGMFSNATSFNQDLGSWDVSLVTNMVNNLQNAPLSIQNYDNLLFGWSKLTLKPGVDFKANLANYCNAYTARQKIITDFGWTIADSGSDCTTSSFNTTWSVAESDNITIPAGTGTFNYTVDWGDGAIWSNQTGVTNHTMGPNPTGIIKITGEFPHFNFDAIPASKDKLISIDQWGTIKWASFSKSFNGCSNLEGIDATDVPDLSTVTLMNSTFQNTPKLERVDPAINDWDVSKVTHMGSLFSGSANSKFNGNISNWDVSKVTIMSYMFSNAVDFNQDLSGWNVEKVTNMLQMFNKATSFNQNLENWNVSLVTNMIDMFKNVTLSIANYDALLIGWNNLPSLKPNVNFHGGNSKYCTGATARANLLSSTGHNWTAITDGSIQTPILNCKSTFTVNLDGSGNATISPQDLLNSFSGCNMELSLSQSTFSCEDAGNEITVTLTATDEEENEVSCDVTVTINETVASFNSDFSPECGPTTVNFTDTSVTSGTDTIASWLWNFGDGATSTNKNPSHTYTTTGQFDVTLNITNSNSCTSSILKEDYIDIIGPIASFTSNSACPDLNTFVFTDESDNATSWSWNFGDGNTSTLQSPSHTYASFGNYTVSLTVELEGEEEENCSDSTDKIINVLEMQAPGFVNVPNDPTTSNDSGVCGAIVNFTPPTASDNCGDITPILISELGPGDLFPIGTTTVKYKATGQTELFTEVEILVTVNDTEIPNVICRNVTITLNEQGTANLTAEIINNHSSDNCGIESVITSKTSFNCDDIGKNEVILMITDINGNSNSCLSIVTVKDEIKPTALSKDITILLDKKGKASISVEDIENGSFDNCGIKGFVMATQNESKSDYTFDCSNIGENIVELYVVDLSGNVSTSKSIVTIEENIKPIALTKNIIVQLDEVGNASIAPSQIDNGSYDVCSDIDLSLNKLNFSCSNIGENMVILAVEDASGNISTKSAIVTVKDNIAPKVLAKNITIELDENEKATITVIDIDNGSSDNCGIASATINKDSFDCSNIGENTVTLTITDTSGNITSTTATVTVKDVTPPIASCTAPFTLVLDETGNASISLDEINNGSSDNCGIKSMSIDKTLFDCSNIGENTITLTIIDKGGNSSSCTTSITIEDKTSPIAITKDLTVELDSAGNVTISPEEINDDSFDECGIETMSLDNTYFECPILGDQIVTLTITDKSGNSTSENAIITFTAPDLDLDGIADACDEDVDGDGVNNDIDNCNTSHNTDQADIDGNGEGDACQGKLYVPRSFSPNNDGINDGLVIAGLQNYTNNRLEIYNRWGNKVFSDQNYQNSWNGFSQGANVIGQNVKVPAGPYFYVLTVSNQLIYKGWIYINY